MLAELALQLYAVLAPPRFDLLARAGAPISVKDPRLGSRPNPAFWDHDANGYRNASVPREAFVVAMGDSQTYGHGVWRGQNWPHQLEERVGRAVYGIANGGWGPTQNLLELDRALALRPRLVIQAFYTGNDLFDCFETVYGDRQLPELATTDATLVRELRAAEESEPLRGRYDRLYALVYGTAPGAQPEEPRGDLGRYSKLYRLASLARRVFDRKLHPPSWEEEKRKALAEPGRRHCQVFESGGIRTILTPALRASAMDLQDPRLAEGFRIALEALRRMDERVRGSGSEFLVLLIPTKELVFGDLALRTLPEAPDYRRLIETEETVRSQAMDFLRSHGVPFVDALPALRESLVRGVQPYKESPDGHPNPAGHRVIADVVAKEMARRGLAATPRGH